MSVLVVGDLMIDDYRIVDVSRVSPEAPCLIGLDDSRKKVLGGAANVAANVRALTEDMLLVGRGDYPAFQDLFSQAQIKSWLIEEPDGYSVKTRFIDKRSNVQLFRYDVEKIAPYFETPRLEHKNAIENLIDFENYKVCVLVDYMKGMFRSDLAFKGCAINLISSKNVRPNLLIPKSDGVNILVVNNLEFSKLQDIEGFQYVVRTEGHRGISGFSVSERMCVPLFHIDGVKVDVFDVTGAGDTVTAVLAFCLSKFGFSESNLAKACACANRAAAKVVSLPGTAIVVDSADSVMKHFLENIP